jgi:hypothetical protein
MERKERKEMLEKALKDIEAQSAPIRDQLEAIYREEYLEMHNRIQLALQAKGDFTLEELIYAAYDKCNCGAGMAYPKGIGIQGSWYCGDILRGCGNQKKIHSSAMPFFMYELKSENQPSAKGATTRPK